MIQWLARCARRFCHQDAAASVAEYGLALALIAVVCISAMALLGTSISSVISSLAGSI